MKLINYERLDKLVKGWEKFKKQEELDLDEEKYLLDILMDRRNKEISKLQVNDTLFNLPFGGLWKKAQKHIQEGGEENE